MESRLSSIRCKGEQPVHTSKRILVLMIMVCLLLPVAVRAEDSFRLIDPPITVKEPHVSIRFAGEVGVDYTLHYKYRNIWLLPATLTLEAEDGVFEVDLGTGRNDFVLVESTQPREAEDAIAFSIDYVTEPVQTATPAPTEKAAAAPTAAPTNAPTQTPVLKVTEAPTAEATQAPAETPIVEAAPVETEEPTPEETEAPTPEPEAEPEPTEEVATERTIRLWAKGNDVEALQAALETLGYKYGRADGVYGPRTRSAVTRFQRDNGLKQDGMVGTEVRMAFEAHGIILPAYIAPDMTMPEGFDRQLSIGKTGMDVHALQEALIAQGYLAGEPDQVYGRHTRSAVRAFQADQGLKVDGVAGPETLRLLLP